MRHRGPRPVGHRGAACAVLLAVLGTVLAPAPAQAHAYLLRTDPGDGGTVQAAPDTLSLTFSEHVVLEATGIVLASGDGRTYRLRHLRLRSADEDIEAPAAVVADLPDLPDDSYRVSWETLSSDDLHRTSGLFVFGVGTAVAASGPSEPAPRPEEAALRWLLLLGIALPLGSALVSGRLPEGGRRLRRLAVGGAATGLVASLLLLGDQLAPGDVPVADLLGGGYGTRWLLREGGLLLLLLAAVLALRGSSARRTRWPLLAGAALSAAGTALLGHAGAGQGVGVTRLLATTAHLLAVTTWAGGVLCLAVLLAPGTAQAPVVRLRVALRSFAVPAATCVGVAVVTGVYLAASVVASVDALLATTYGRTLMVKITLVAAMAGLGLANHRRLRGRHDLDLPRRGVRGEAALAVLVLAATGVLTSGQPATEPVFQRPPAGTAGPVSTQVADLQQAVSLRPNRPGSNVVLVDVFDTRRPAPGEVVGVDVRLSGTSAGSSAVAAEPLGEGHWSLDVADVPAGATSVGVTVHRAGLPDVTSRTPWTVGAGPAARRTLVSTAPLGPTLRGLAAGLAVLLGAAGAGALWVRRSGRLHPRQQRGVDGSSGLPRSQPVVLLGEAHDDRLEVADPRP